MKQKPKNVYYMVTKRSCFGSTVAQDLKLIRLFIEKKSSKFTKAWSKISKDPIGFDCQHLFLEKFRTSYSTSGIPRELYRMQPLKASEKVESAVAFESPLDQESFLGSLEHKGHKGFKSCVIGVTANGYLFRQDMNTGERLQTVFLSKTIKFKTIFWETDLIRIAVKSIQTKPLPRSNQGSRGHSSDILLYLALFDVAPLRFISLIPIDKNIFGSTVTDASVFLGCLCIMHRTGLTELYSVQEILEEYSHTVDLGEVYTLHNYDCHSNNMRMPCYEKQGIVGCHPFGIPVNVNMTSKPNVLFQVPSLHHHVSFGGFSWHYVVSPPKENSLFYVRSLKDHQLAVNGIIKSDVLSVEPDQAYFHADHSGRIVHVCPQSVRILKLHSPESPEEEVATLTNCFTISIEGIQDQQDAAPMYTSSGRLVKRIQSSAAYSNPEYDTIQDIDYEDELDLLVVLSSRDSSNGRIGLYDNQTGALIREVILNDWNEECDHSILMERDLIVHICRTPFKKFSCTLYKLS